MGDHRASIKVTFSAHGVERKWDAFITYDPSEEIFWRGTHRKIDPRVVEFFDGVWDECMDAYHALMAESYERQRQEEERARIPALRARLAELEQKYPATPTREDRRDE